MDWGFLNIFKKAEFNTLMFAAAVACWVLYFIHHDNDLYLGVALLCTIYCIVRLIVYIYKLSCAKAQDRKNRDYQNKIAEEKALDKKRQAQYVYDRQSAEAQQILCNIVKIGKKSVYSDVYILYDKLMYTSIITQLKMMRCSDRMLAGWISIDETADSYCIYINPPLNIVIEECLTMK